MADDIRILSHITVVVSLSFLFSSQCLAVSQLDLCVLRDFDVWNLTSRIWKFSVPKRFCLAPKTDNTTVDGCEITMAFCQPVNLTGSCGNSSVCETYTSSANTYSLAAYTPDSNPFSKAQTSEVGFSMNLEAGEKYSLSSSTTCTLKTLMVFRCNATAVWESEEGSTEVLKVPVSSSVALELGSDICNYNFTFDFAGACPYATHGTVGQLSAGSILLMIFLVSVIMYFVMGCFVNTVRGKSGQELIPHHKFWFMLPVYIMDGLLFTTQCGKRRSKQTYENI